MYVAQQKANLALQLHASRNKMKSGGRGISKHYIIMGGEKVPIQNKCFLFFSRDQCVMVIVIKGNEIVVRLCFLKLMKVMCFYVY